MSATLGLDDSAYRQGVEEAKSQTRDAVSTMMKDYNRLYSEVIHLTAAYQKSRRETGEASKETKEFAQKLKEAQAQLNTTAQGLKTAEGYMNSFGDATSGSSKSLAGAIAQGTIMAGLFSKLSSAALAAAKSFIQSGIDYNAQIESYRVGLTNMLGDAQAANEAMAAIQEDAARTPFSVESLTQANQLLISAGENAGYSREVILALGNAVSAAGGGNEELSRMASNLQQIANVGKASAIDIKQFAYAGINVYQVLADYTGKSVQEVQNMTISYDTLSQALIAASEEGGRYYNSMDTQSQTMNGRVSTLKDNVSQLAGLMTGNLTDSVGVVIDKLNDMTVAAIEAYKQDGWWAMAGAALSTVEPIEQIGSAIGGVLSKARELTREFSYWVSSKTVPNFAYGSYEEFSEALDLNERRTEGSRQKERNRRQYLHNQRLAASRAAAAAAGSSIPTSGDDNDDDDTPKPVAADTKKLADSVTETSKQILAGTGNIVGSIQRVTETAENTYNVYDGTTKKIKGNTTETVRTITDTWTEVVDGTEKTFKKITKTGTDAAKNTTTTVTQTCDNVVLSVTEVQSRIDRNLAAAKSKWAGGIFGTLQNVVMDLKSGNWAGLAMDFAQLIWGEVSQDQRDIISKWADDALGVVSEAYSGGGLKSAAGVLKTLFVDGIAAGATEAGTAVASLGEIISGLGASGGVGAQIAGIATQFSGVASSIMGSLGGIVSMVASNPILAAILGVTVVAGGVGLAAWLSGKNKDKKDPPKTSSAMSYKDIQDAYWYGSMRSMAGYDFRTDGRAYPSSPAGSQLTAYQQKMQASVEALYGVVQQYLPQAGNQIIKLDDGTLVGALAPSMDAQLGHLAALAERGN